MNKAVFKLIVAKEFFTTYCPKVISWQKKLAGTTRPSGKVEDFTEEDRELINKGLERLKTKLKV